MYRVFKSPFIFRIYRKKNFFFLYLRKVKLVGKKNLFVPNFFLKLGKNIYLEAYFLRIQEYFAGYEVKPKQDIGNIQIKLNLYHIKFIFQKIYFSRNFIFE